MAVRKSVTRKLLPAGASVRKQITDSFRQKLESGELKPGDRLPSTLELARLWNTQEPTIQRALAPLVKEGHLDRTPRLGTFVNHRSRKAVTIGIYAPNTLWRNELYRFSRMLIYELQKQLEAASIEAKLFIDPRPLQQQTTAWDGLLDAITISRLDALIVPMTDLPHLNWLAKLPVPSVYQTGKRMPNRVTFDMRSMATGALELLVKQGCKSVGMIMVGSFARKSDGSESELTEFHSQWTRTCKRLRLENRREWTLNADPSNRKRLDEHWYERFGHDSVERLMKMKVRPDGMFVYTDDVARGAIMAALRHGTKFEKAVKLVLHRNTQVGLFCPLPAAFVEVDISKVAAALIEQALLLRNGKTVVEKLVPYDFIPAA